MIENIGGIELTDEYWDCECEKNFIHPRSEAPCVVCEAQREDQPNSRLTEVLKHGFIINEREQGHNGYKRTGFRVNKKQENE